jgi:hypothetical protein
VPEPRLASPVRIALLLVGLIALLYAGSLWRVEKPRPPSTPAALAVPTSDVEVQVLNESGLPGMALRVTRFLRERGFDVVETGNGSRVSLPETEVVVRGDDMELGARIARSLNCSIVRSDKDADQLVDVTVFIGKDIERLVILPD